MDEATLTVIRFEGSIGGAGNIQPREDADRMMVALAVALGRLPAAAELKALAAHLRAMGDHVEEIQVRPL